MMTKSFSIGIILKKVSTFVTCLLKEQLPPDLRFHDWEHTAFVVHATYQIGMRCGFSDQEMENVMIAAWFHDTGYIHQYKGHEERSSEIAQTFLNTLDYDAGRVMEVKECIGATRMPQCPITLPQKVLCDADMVHLASKNYIQRLALLRWEWYVKLDKLYSDEQWYQENLKFIRKHEYFTPFARKQYKKGKLINLEKLQVLINR